MEEVWFLLEEAMFDERAIGRFSTIGSLSATIRCCAEAVGTSWSWECNEEQGQHDSQVTRTRKRGAQERPERLVAQVVVGGCGMRGCRVSDTSGLGSNERRPEQGGRHGSRSDGAEMARAVSTSGRNRVW